MVEKPKRRMSLYLKTILMDFLTACDFWVHDFSKSKLKKRMISLVDFYNQQLIDYQNTDKIISVEKFVNKDKTQIKWHSNLYEI